jgi:hypothetical protein
MRPLKRRLALNASLPLDDGRMLIIKRGAGKTIIGRQKAHKNNDPIRVGDIVHTKPQSDQSVVRLEAVSRTKKDIRFRIHGRFMPKKEEDDGPLNNT